MSEILRSESKTQNCVIQLFTGLGYDYLSEWNKQAIIQELFTGRARLA